MKKIMSLFFIIGLAKNIIAQNVGIGTTTPTLGKLEINGAAGTGTTVAAFGTDGAGVSLQRSSPVIGFNQYRDAIGSKYMSNGFASTITLDETTGIMAWDMHANGFKGNATINPIRALTILNNGNIGIRGIGASNIGLVIAKKPENIIGTAVFDGYNHSSFFANSLNENTYLRSASSSGSDRVIINEITNGVTLMPNNTKIGFGGSLNPVTSLELYGSLGITKRVGINICGNVLANPGNNSFIDVTTCNTTPAILTLADGLIQGQILLVYGGIGDNKSIIVNETANIDLAGSFTMVTGSTLLLIWRIVSPGVGRWTEISRRSF